MSHREEFEKALDDFGRKARNDAFPTDASAEVTEAARAEVLRLYDEKPPTRSDLEAVAREALTYVKPSHSESHAEIEVAAEVVTRYLEERR